MRHLIPLVVVICLTVCGCKPLNPSAKTVSGLSVSRTDPSVQEIAKSLGLETWKLSIPDNFGPKVEIQFGDYDGDGKCLGLAKLIGVSGGSVTYRPMPDNRFVISTEFSTGTCSRRDFSGKQTMGCPASTPISAGNEIILFREVTRFDDKPGVSPSTMSKVKGMFVIRVCPSGTPDESVLVNEIIAGKHSF